METSIAESGADSTLTLEEKIQCHKARIFGILTKAPVVRAWKDATCDGAVYCGNRRLPSSYADRYFQVSRGDISYVTFSIVTLFRTGIPRNEGDILPAQCENSEFLILTFYDDHNKVAVLPHGLYWPGDSAKGKDLVIDISDPELDSRCVPIACLLAHIGVIRTMTMNPMQPTTTLIQFALEGRIPKAGTPEAIMSDSMEEEGALRAIHKIFHEQSPHMKVDFLDYQPLLRDFKLVISPCDEFRQGLEPVISHITRASDPSTQTIPNSEDLRNADYILTQAKSLQNYVFFIPRRLIHEDWFIDPRPHESMPQFLYDSDRKLKTKEFILNTDYPGIFANGVWEIIRKYPPSLGPDPTTTTPAQEKQEIWRKALPWPIAQPALNKGSTLQKDRGDKEDPDSRNDSGTGDDDAVKPSDTSLLVTHYSKKLSLDDEKGEDDAT